MWFFFSLLVGKVIIYIIFIFFIRLCCINFLFNCLFVILCIFNKGVLYLGDCEGYWVFCLFRFFCVYKKLLSFLWGFLFLGFYVYVCFI